MQTLGLSPSTPKTESRLKTLLWPTIRHESDVEVVAQQGFWICFVVAAFTLIVGVLQGFFVTASFESGFFFLGGIGVRQRSRFAAIVVFSTYLLSTIMILRFLLQGPGIVRIIFLALLLANVRASWLSAKWPATERRPLPESLTETFGDKLADRVPAYLWPKLKWIFYAATGLEAALLLLVLLAPRQR